MGKAMDLINEYEKNKVSLDFAKAVLGSDKIFDKVFNKRS